MSIELKDSVTVVTKRGKSTTEESIYITVEKCKDGIEQIYISPSGSTSYLSLGSAEIWDTVKARVDRMIARIETLDAD